ncbi:hypothetical protein WAI453_004789 [Rhynchosporium graminicola]
MSTSTPRSVIRGEFQPWIRNFVVLSHAHSHPQRPCLGYDTSSQLHLHHLSSNDNRTLVNDSPTASHQRIGASQFCNRHFGITSTLLSLLFVVVPTEAAPARERPPTVRSARSALSESAIHSVDIAAFFISRAVCRSRHTIRIARRILLQHCFNYLPMRRTGQTLLNPDLSP